MKVFSSRKAEIEFILILLVISLVLAGIYLFFQESAQVFLGPRTMAKYVRSFGALSPVVFIFLQILQILFAPVPGYLFGFLGGYLFGAFRGSLYSMIGVTLGSLIAFHLAKKYGRPYVEKFFHEDFISRFDSMARRAGPIGIFIFFFLPGLPDDLICFLAGMTGMSTWLFLLIVIVGRSPGFFLLNLSGSKVASESYTDALLILVLIAVVAISIYLEREKVSRFVKKLKERIKN